MVVPVARAPPQHVVIRGVSGALRLVEGDQTGARGPHRMTKGDCSAVDIDLVQIRVAHACPRKRDRSERLIHLEQVDIRLPLPYLSLRAGIRAWKPHSRRRAFPP